MSFWCTQNLILRPKVDQDLNGDQISIRRKFHEMGTRRHGLRKFSLHAVVAEVPIQGQSAVGRHLDEAVLGLGVDLECRLLDLLSGHEVLLRAVAHEISYAITPQ